MTSPLGITTQILHSDRKQDVSGKAPFHHPVHMGVSYGFTDATDLIEIFQGTQSGYVYSRQGTPTTSALETKITQLEGGVGTVTVGTGMAAIAAVLLSLLQKGDELIVSQYLFGNTTSMLETLKLMGVVIHFVDTTEVEHVQACVNARTRIVFLETVANPSTQVSDLEGIGALCKQHGILYVVDATLNSPYLFQAKSVGAHLVVHSLTKYISGHGNALGGSITDTGLFDWTGFPNIYHSYRSSPAHLQGITQIRKKGVRDFGASLGSDTAHRIAVGLETLVLRMQRICDSALRLAQWLDQHPCVTAVHYPGLTQHPQHARAHKLFKGYGGLLSFSILDSIDVVKFMNALQVVVPATHLGDNRTLAIPVAKTIYWELGEEKRAELGIAEGLIRLSVGIEEYQDLQNDLDQAFKKN